jgi:uncharacterized protein
MTARSLSRPDVTIVQKGTVPTGGTLALYALNPASVNGLPMAGEDLIITEGPVTLTSDWPVIVVRFHGLNLPR